MRHRLKLKVFDKLNSGGKPDDKLSNSYIPSTFTNQHHANDPLFHSKSTYFYRWYQENKSQVKSAQNGFRLLNITTLSALALVAGVGINLLNSNNASAASIALNLTKDYGESTTPNTITATEITTDDVANGNTVVREYTFDVTYSGIDQYWIGINTENGHGGRLVGRANPAFQISGVGKNVAASDFTDNTWGYALDSTTYNTVPELNKPMAAIMISVTNSETPDTKNHTLDFAARLGSDAPSDHYETKVYLSVTMNAEDITNAFGITTMQEMTSQICSQATDEYRAKLIDRRDHNDYWITKLTDGNCWMTQNLRLTGPLNITSKDSDVSTNFSLPAPLDNLSDFNDSNVAQSYYNGSNAYGAYYNWYSATAGTGNSSLTTMNQIATSSICPKGWKLPTSVVMHNLIQVYNIQQGNGNMHDSAQKLRNSPLNFIFAGYITNSEISGFNTMGMYWTSTVAGQYKTYHTYFSEGILRANDTNYYRNDGMSVRCVYIPKE